MGEESIAQKPHTRRQGRVEDGRKRRTGRKQRPETTQWSRGKKKNENIQSGWNKQKIQRGVGGEGSESVLTLQTSQRKYRGPLKQSKTGKEGYSAA